MELLAGSAGDREVVGAVGGAEHHHAEAFRPPAEPLLLVDRHAEQSADDRSWEFVGEGVDEINCDRSGRHVVEQSIALGADVVV